MTNPNTPAVFNFNDAIQVRTFLDENQNPWFLAKDVCAVLGYKNDSDAIKKHCKEHGVAKRDLIDNLNRKQKASYINEGNLYRLIVKSKKPEAEKFEVWVMEEVLPAIRKTGSFTAETTKSSKSTSDERTPLRNAINLLVSKKRILYPEAYSYIHQKFNIKHIDELDALMLPVAVEYIHKLALDGELLEKEAMYTIKLTDEELCSLAWLWKAADYMRSRIEEVEAPLRALRSDYAASFYSISTEYGRLLKRTKVILERETREITPHPVNLTDANWRYALESLRS